MIDERVRAVIHVMRTNLDRPLPIVELARSFQISPSHLRRLFKTETGTSLGRSLRQLRLEEASRLLETTYLSVKEVASRVGIGGVSHFVRDFKTDYGLTPAKYRGRHRGARHVTRSHRQRSA